MGRLVSFCNRLAIVQSFAGVREILAEDDELVPTKPGYRVAGPHRRAEASGQLDEHLIASLVPEAVVDDLEPVDVDEYRAQRPVSPWKDSDGLGQPVDEQDSVGQPGQSVVERLPYELFLDAVCAR